MMKCRECCSEKYEPVYISEKFIPVAEERVSRFSEKEADRYLQERKNIGIKD
jgi:hypothetical protein